MYKKSVRFVLAVLMMGLTTIAMFAVTAALTASQVLAAADLNEYYPVEMPAVQLNGHFESDDGSKKIEFAAALYDFAIRSNASYLLRGADTYLRIPFRIYVQHRLGEKSILNFNEGIIILTGEFSIDTKTGDWDFSFQTLERNDTVAMTFGFNKHINIEFANKSLQPVLKSAFNQIPVFNNQLVHIARQSMAPGTKKFPLRHAL